MSNRNRNSKWDRSNVPDQAGKTVIITGANSGIGLETARMMAEKGAHVIMACRNIERSKPSHAIVNRESTTGNADLIRLDLSEFSSIRDFVSEVKERFPKIDILINNAGVMAPPYGLTKDGFELQFGTNHLGHFLLTGLLLGNITGVAGSRIVTITSIAHINGTINFDDLKSEKRYRRMEAYRQSKLANLIFAYELQRRLAAAGSETISVAVHPGVSSTALVVLPPLLERLKDALLMSPEKGALPTMMGATEPSVRGGEYIGPDGFRQAFGFPAILQSNSLSHDPETARRLWDVSEELTGLKYEF